MLESAIHNGILVCLSLRSIPSGLQPSCPLIVLQVHIIGWGDADFQNWNHNEKEAFLKVPHPACPAALVCATNYLFTCGLQLKIPKAQKYINDHFSDNDHVMVIDGGDVLFNRGTALGPMAFVCDRQECPTCPKNFNRGWILLPPQAPSTSCHNCSSSGALGQHQLQVRAAAGTSCSLRRRIAGSGVLPAPCCVATTQLFCRNCMALS